MTCHDLSNETIPDTNSAVPRWLELPPFWKQLRFALFSTGKGGVADVKREKVLEPSYILAWI